MNKAVVVIAALIALAVVACGGEAPTASRGEANEIIGRGAVRVCSTGDYRPFTYRDAQGWTGMDIDLAHNFAEHLEVKLKLVPTTWAGLLDDVGTKCDMAMGGISINAERAKRALFSQPYLRDGKAAIVRCADSANYRTLGDIDRPYVRVVVNPGGGNAAFDKANLHRAMVIIYPDNNTIFGQLIEGKADVMITDASEIRWETKQEPRLCGVGVDNPFNSEDKAYLIPQNDPILQLQVNDWLRVAQGNGVYADICDKWLGRAVTP